jgi:hypothetical protein
MPGIAGDRNLVFPGFGNVLPVSSPPTRTPDRRAESLRWRSGVWLIQIVFRCSRHGHRCYIAQMATQHLPQEVARQLRYQLHQLGPFVAAQV